jgi:ubiquinone/menaquinone biosynthesis C-methylase UbiE
MSQEQQFYELSYKLHEDHFKTLDDGVTDQLENWLREDTVDYWRHSRMYNPITPIAKAYKNAKWLTVGDGRYGFDSMRLKKMEPSISVLPTDISPYQLEKAKRLNLIEDYKVENAEKLSFNDNEFDLTLCKEAFHHFPRPYIALYEMLRVSKKGVILIEPREKFPDTVLGTVITTGKNVIKKIIGKPVYQHDFYKFETVGNYVFSVSKREMEKIALGLQLPYTAFFYYNDFYEPGVETEEMNRKSELFKRIKRKVTIADLKCKAGIAYSTGIIAVLFKETPNESLLKQLAQRGFVLNKVLVNPYLSEKTL